MGGTAEKSKEDGDESHPSLERGYRKEKWRELNAIAWQSLKRGEKRDSTSQSKLYKNNC